jgi:hypothetical protein
MRVVVAVMLDDLMSATAGDGEGVTLRNGGLVRLASEHQIIQPGHSASGRSPPTPLGPGG